MRRARDLLFGALALALVAVYVWIGSSVSGFAGPTSSSPTPPPTAPAERTGAPRLPGAIAFALRADIYVLRDGRYARSTSEGRNSQPALSADGSTLYFAREEEIDGQRVTDGALVNARLGFSSVVRKPSGGGTEQVVLNGLRQRRADGQHLVTWYLGPAPSPDGSVLAVTADDGDGAADLGTLKLNGLQAGARPTFLTQGAEIADPAWSPDGKSIVTTVYGGKTPELWVWDVARAGDPRPIEGLPDGEPYRPSFSPDGRWVAYTLRHAGLSDVHAFELSARRDVALTSDGKSWNGVFSPDGKYVAFLGERSGVIDLFAMELGDALGNGTPKDPIKLTSGEGVDGASRPSWAP